MQYQNQKILVLACKDNVAEIIINHSSINTNRIKFSVDCDNDDCQDMSVVCFSSGWI